MNERIKEMALKSGAFNQVYANKELWINEWFDVEKFAELIVRECASKVDWILAEGGKTQGDLIKEHFGVEE